MLMNETFIILNLKLCQCFDAWTTIFRSIFRVPKYNTFWSRQWYLRFIVVVLKEAKQCTKSMVNFVFILSLSKHEPFGNFIILYISWNVQHQLQHSIKTSEQTVNGKWSVNWLAGSNPVWDFTKLFGSNRSMIRK